MQERRRPSLCATELNDLRKSAQQGAWDLKKLPLLPPGDARGDPCTQRGSTREPLPKSSKRRATLASRRRACRWSRFLLPRRRPPGCRLRTLLPRRWRRATASRSVGLGRGLHLLPAQRSNCSEARVSGGGRTPRSLYRRRTRTTSTRSARCLPSAHASATTVLTTRTLPLIRCSSAAHLGSTSAWRRRCSCSTLIELYPLHC